MDPPERLANVPSAVLLEAALLLLAAPRVRSPIEGGLDGPATTELTPARTRAEPR